MLFQIANIAVFRYRISGNIGAVLNLAIRLQTGHSKILAEFKFDDGRNLAGKLRPVLIYLAESNLAIPASIAKPPILIPLQYFHLYGIYIS